MGEESNGNKAGDSQEKDKPNQDSLTGDSHESKSEDWGSVPEDGASEEESPRFQPAYYFDVWIYRIAVSSLGLTLVIAATGAVMWSLGFGDVSDGIPDVLIALGSGAVGALAGLLAPRNK